jgi:CDP-alcohol phosphatidyltransferase
MQLSEVLVRPFVDVCRLFTDCCFCKRSQDSRQRRWDFKLLEMVCSWRLHQYSLHDCCKRSQSARAVCVSETDEILARAMRLLLAALLLLSVSYHAESASITSARPAAWQKKLSLIKQDHNAACLRASLSLRGGGPLTRGTKDDSAATVLTYLPNLIGYFRVALLATSIALAPRADKWVTSIWAYIVSFALDGADGYAARWLNQTSKVGILLDMITGKGEG